MAPAVNPDLPVPSGDITLPGVSPGMNKIAPSANSSEWLPDDEQEILRRARKRLDYCISEESELRKQELEDQKFLAGEQWPADVVMSRTAESRPMLTINKLPTFVHQITNDIRQNRPSIIIRPNGNNSINESALIFQGWIREIQRESAADIAYDTATQHAVSIGRGYWRILSEYVSHESFDQTICIKRIRNPFSVYMDPNRQEPEGSDSRYCFITEILTRDEFEELYPDADPIEFTQAGIGDEYRNWADQDSVRIAEYYEIVHESRNLVHLENGFTGFEDELSEDHPPIVNMRKVEVPKQYWYKLTAKEILECREWPGRWIPIVQVIGDEYDIQGRARTMGIVRSAKDSVRMYNYWSTAETELVALAPKAPFIMEEGQVEGHEDKWAMANQRSYPYLLYKGTSVSGKASPPPQRQQFSGSPQGIVAAKMAAAQDMMGTTGVRFDATLNERLHDESGRAIREVRRSSDIGSFHYSDNLSRSLKHTGEILLDLAPHYLDTSRFITIINDEDKEESVKIDPNAPVSYSETRGPDGKNIKVFNPKIGRYTVTVTTGPSYATRRIESAESMMAFAKALPQQASLIADLLAKAQDWPGSEEIARRLTRALPPQLLSPDQKDIPPQLQAIVQALQQQLQQLQQQNQQLQAAVLERDKDRAVAQDKINKDFEAKLLQIAQKSQSENSDRVLEISKHLQEVIERSLRSLPAGSTGQKLPVESSP